MLRRKCKHCGHRIHSTKDLKWVHDEPHPDNICKCTNPEPWTANDAVEDVKKQMSLVHGGVSTYQGYIDKGAYLE